MSNKLQFPDKADIDSSLYYRAASSPLVTSDTAHGYWLGQRWVNTITLQEYRCDDPANGAAVWTALESATPAGSALDGLTPAADKVPYFTGPTTAALASLTSFGRSVIGCVDAAALIVVLGLGTMATQNANAVAITGGAIDGTAIGGTVKAALGATNIAATGTITTTSVASGVLGIGTASPQRTVHISMVDATARTILALENTDTTDTNGIVYSYRTATTGAGAASFVELAAINVTFTTHDHATKASTMSFYTAVAGTVAARLTINTAGNLSIAPSTDNSLATGYGLMGFASGGTAGDFYIGVVGHMTSTDYGLRIKAAGAAVLNSATGQAVALRVNNVDVLNVQSVTQTITQGVATSGSASGFVYTAAAHTTLTTGTETNDISFNLGRIVQWATTTPSLQRAYRIIAPTYACDSVSQTIATAVTLDISGAPVAGTNVTLTNALALRVASGNVEFSVSTDNTFTTGYGKMGLASSGTSTAFYVAQASNYNSTDYALKQLANGATTINSKSSVGGVVLAVNNSAAFTASATVATVASGLTFVCSNTTDGTSGSAAAISTLGGIGVTKAAWIGTNVTWANGVASGTVTDAITNTNTLMLTLQHFSSGTVANGFGGAIKFNGHDDGATNRSMGQISCLWTTAASATRTSAITFSTSNNAGGLVEGFRVGGASCTFASGFPVIISDATDGTSGTAGSISSLGGLGLTKALWVGTTATVVGNTTLTGTSGLTITQTAAAGGSRTSLVVTQATNTTAASGVESRAVNFNFSATRTWATSTPATNREFIIQAPTYACDTVSQTITNAATLAITNAPANGTNVTITNAYALWVQAGISRFDGNVSINDAINVVLGTTTGTKFGTATTQKMGFWNAAPVIQPTVTTAAGAAVVTTGSALASYGYTQAQADDIVAQLNKTTARVNDLATKLQTIGITA